MFKPRAVDGTVIPPGTRIGKLREHVEIVRIADEQLAAIFRPVFGSDERAGAHELVECALPVHVLRRGEAVMFCSVDKADRRRHHIEHTVVEVGEKFAHIVRNSLGVRLGSSRKGAHVMLDRPEEEIHAVGKFPECARKDLASALTGEARALLEGNILFGGGVKILERSGIFLGVEHKPFKARLFGETREHGEIVAETRPRRVVDPGYPVLLPGGGNPGQKETLLQTRILDKAAQIGKLIFDVFIRPDVV